MRWRKTEGEEKPGWKWAAASRRGRGQERPTEKVTDEQGLRGEALTRKEGGCVYSVKGRCRRRNQQVQRPWGGSMVEKKHSCSQNPVLHRPENKRTPD